MKYNPYDIIREEIIRNYDFSIEDTTKPSDKNNPFKPDKIRKAINVKVYYEIEKYRDNQQISIKQIESGCISKEFKNVLICEENDVPRLKTKCNATKYEYIINLFIKSNEKGRDFNAKTKDMLAFFCGYLGWNDLDSENRFSYKDMKANGLIGSPINKGIENIKEEIQTNIFINNELIKNETSLLSKKQSDIHLLLNDVNTETKKLDEIRSQVNKIHSTVTHNGLTISYKKISNQNTSIRSFSNYNVNFGEFLINAIDFGINIQLNKFLHEHKQESIQKFEVLKSILNSDYENLLYLNDTNHYLSRLGIEDTKIEFDTEIYSDLIHKNINSTLTLDFIKLGYYLGKGMIDEMVTNIFPDDPYSDETFNDILNIETSIKKYLAYYDLDHLYFEFYPKINKHEENKIHKENSNITEFLIQLKCATREKYFLEKNQVKETSEISEFIYEIFLLGRDIQFLEFYYNRTEDDNDHVYSLKKIIESFSIEEHLEERINYLGFIYEEITNLNISIYDYYYNQIKSPLLLDFFRVGYLIAKDTLFAIGLIGQELDFDIQSPLEVREKAFLKIKLIFLEYNMIDFFEKEYPNIIIENNIFQLNNDIDVFIFKMRNALNSKF